VVEAHRFTPASNARRNIRPSANSSAASPFSPGPFLGRRHGALRFGGVDARFPRVDRLEFLRHRPLPFLGGARSGQVGGQIPPAHLRQRRRIGRGDNQPRRPVRSIASEDKFGGPPGSGVPIMEAPLHRHPRAGLFRPVPGRLVARSEFNKVTLAASPGCISPRPIARCS
jgi:hypothetical protein